MNTLNMILRGLGRPYNQQASQQVALDSVYKEICDNPPVNYVYKGVSQITSQMLVYKVIDVITLVILK